jgi:hypothetical protein
MPSTSSILRVGERWRIAVDVESTDVSAPAYTVTPPSGSPVAGELELVEGESASWEVFVETPAAGRYLAEVTLGADVLHFAAYAYAITTAGGMPVVGDVVIYLKEDAASWETEDLEDELASQAAAQRAKCGERAAYPPDLRQALLRRVQRALALRSLPLAIQQGDADGGPMVIPGNDPEVRSLEGPYRRRVMG